MTISTDPHDSTALMIGRFQPFHAGHKALFEEALRMEGHVLIGVRNTFSPEDDKNPFDFYQVQKAIHIALAEYSGKFDVVLLPNITNVVYGRGVGYKITPVELPAEIQAISATKIREGMKSDG
jgi:adenylylsulfate kinase